jgi:hypothetical protein
MDSPLNDQASGNLRPRNIEPESRFRPIRLSKVARSHIHETAAAARSNRRKQIGPCAESTSTGCLGREDIAAGDARIYLNIETVGCRTRAGKSERGEASKRENSSTQVEEEPLINAEGIERSNGTDK